MNQYILTIMSKLLAYNDSAGVTNNPKQRAFDHTRNVFNISISKPFSENRSVAPGSSLTLFDGTKSTGLVAASSTLALSLLSAQDSVYALEVTAGPSGFRTARAVSGVTSCSVSINNNALAVFDFTGASMGAVQVGDIMKIAGAVTYDTGPFAFSGANSGTWNVIGVSGTKISATRLVGEMFSGVAEVVAAVGAGDVQFYSSSGVQKGDKFYISALFSVVSQKAYEVLEAEPDRILFVSAQPLPEETGLVYTANAITVYDNLKRLVYIEVDQNSEIRLNGDSGSSILVSPIEAGNKDLVGWFHKFGPTWKCEILNRSVNPLNVYIVSGE